MSNDSPKAPNVPSGDCPPREDSVRQLTRRHWLKRTAWMLFAGGVAAAVYTYWIEPFWVDFVERDLPIANLPPRGKAGSLYRSVTSTSAIA